MNTNQPLPPDPDRDVLQDADYKSMLFEFQQGKWDECEQLIARLDEKYPGNPKIADLKSNFELQRSIINGVESSAKDDEKKQRIRNIKKIAMIAGALIGAILIIWFGVKMVLDVRQKKLLQERANQINILSVQVELLLDFEQIEKADELIQMMQAIDPTSPKTIELAQKKDKILKLNVQYLDALDKLSKGLDSDALSTLIKIESDHPGYKDVPQLIESTTNKIKISQALSNGTEAYIGGRWQEAIDNFEQVLTLEPENSAPNLKGMLINSYLHQSILLLNNNEITFADINQAEYYYSQANAMFPQSKVFLSEREQLRKDSSSLLEEKYTQAANQMIEDPAQTMDSLDQAFAYLSKASSLDRQNPSLLAEIYQINLYRTGFRYYVDMNWQMAIKKLNVLTTIEDPYANSFFRKLLYEAHVSQGAQYFSAGAYLSARTEYEAAEILASGSDNLISLYLVEIDLGNTLGKLNQFEDADSHFIKAIQSINYEKRGIASTTFLSNLGSAVKYNTDGQYETAYNLFYETLVGNDIVYDMKNVNVHQGNCLALLAAQYQSSVQAILEKNNLPTQTVVASDQALIIPYIP
jgi:tetratricopeptide (TPR) repeat protein